MMVAQRSDGDPSPAPVCGMVCPHFAITFFGEMR